MKPGRQFTARESDVFVDAKELVEHDDGGRWGWRCNVGGEFAALDLNIYCFGHAVLDRSQGTVRPGTHCREGWK
jgi:hypothetical protein